MRAGSLSIALIALGVSIPCNAGKLFIGTISGVVTGTTTTIMCNPNSPPGCLSQYGGSGMVFSPYFSEFSFGYGEFLEEGDNYLSYGFERNTGAYMLTIHRAGDVLTGKNLTFHFEDSNYRFGAIGAGSVWATASSFFVTGGVPEPSTWAMLILGFGIVGARIRRRVSVRSRFALA